MATNEEAELESRSSETDTPAPPDRGLEMLSAAHVLLSSDRMTDEHDLLISTCLEALDLGPASSAKLANVCNEIWPGAHISIDSISTSMSEAQELGLVAVQVALDGEDWALAQQGKNEIDSTREWFSNAMDRLARQVQDRARDDFGELTFEVASNWARIILRLFSNEIARSAASYAGAVERGAAGTIRPMVLDGIAMLKSIDSLQLEAGTSDFLKACLLAAVDEVDPFGNELVGQIATSCVLHAIASRRGRAGAQAKLGSLAGERVVLDTPILLALLSHSGAETRLRSIIETALNLGMEVIAPEHVFDELDDVLERVTKEHLSGLAGALRGGVNPRAYAQIVNEQILELFLDGVEKKKYRNWGEFRRRADGLRDELASLKVNVRDHKNLNRSNVAWTDSELTEVIAHSASGRGTKAIARDAESIEMVWRARRRSLRRKPRTSLWPGGWLVTYDRHLNAAYRILNRADDEPIAITPAQLATLMTEASPASGIPDLVAAAASYVRQESMLRIATKYPAAIALTLARSLSGEYTSTTDVRIAQLPTLGDLLEQTAAGQSITGERLASELASKRSNRLAAAGREQIDLVGLERERLDAALVRSDVIVGEEHAARVEAERRLKNLEERQALGPRQTAAAIVTTALVALVALFVVIGFWSFAAGTGISAFAFFFLSRRWTRDVSVGIATCFWAAIPEILGLVDIANRLGWFGTA